MKKFFSILSFLFFSIALCGCVSRKDRISSDTLAISIDPAELQTVATGGQVQLRAICRSAKSEDADINPTWMVENNLGSFNPPSGKTTVFTAGTASGVGKITAVFDSIRSNEVIVPIGTYHLPSILLSDVIFDHALDRDPLDSSKLNFHYFDTDNSSPWQISTAEITPGCPVDSAKAIRVEYTYSNPGWGGIYLEYSAAKNLSAYSKLTFWIKGTTGNEKLQIGMADATPFSYKVNVANYISMSSTWQKVTIPLNDITGVSMLNIKQPFIIAFDHVYTADNACVYIDFMRFEP